ncbi:MAG: prephenate dehydrogenase/arogenate dehydrogenase family protein [bacterium]
MSSPAGSEIDTSPGRYPLKRIAIFGPGLIGGSIALALRGRTPETSLTIWGRKPELLREILRRDLADSVEMDPVLAVRGADLVVICTPVGVMEEIAKTIAPHLEPHALVTDAGSVKNCVVTKLTPFLGNRFLGGHPMAGSERSGLDAARQELFAGAPCILTPTATTPPEVLASITEFWAALGASVTTMSPSEHDRLVARLSHLPHAIAFALVNLVSSTLPEKASLLAGGSFRDGTRVAGSNPSLWAGILSENREEVGSALREMATLLTGMAHQLESGDSNSILDFLTRAKEHRDQLPLPRPDEFL